MKLISNDVFTLEEYVNVRMNDIDDLTFGYVGGDIHEHAETLVEDPVYDMVWERGLDHVMHQTRDLIYE